MQSDLLMKLWLCNTGGEEHTKYKQQLIGMLKAGQLVVQMLAAEEVMTMPDGSRKATFLLDTWDMVLPLLLPRLHFAAVLLQMLQLPMLHTEMDA